MTSIDPHSPSRTVSVGVLAVLLVAMSLPAAPQSRMPPPRQQDGPTITPNYKDADLSQIIQAVSEVTGKNFIIDPRVNAKVTMLSATPMSPAAFYEAFLAVLQVYGYVAVPAGKVIKIVPNTDARQLPSIDLPNDVSTTSDEIVTQIITMKNVSAAQLVPLLRPLIPQQGHLAAYPSGNMLIISDRASNVSRIMKIIQRMDESGDEPVEIIQLKNASATELVRTVNSLSQGQAAEGAGAPVKIVADERTNSVLVSGEKSLRLKIKALIINLDTPLLSGGDTQVRYLRYADAEKIADKLKGQASASAKALAGPQGSAPAAASGSSGANVDASVTIWADVATNALIITAPPKIMKGLMAVIDKLDIRRAQVQVEAIIVEVDVNKSTMDSVRPGFDHTCPRHQFAGQRHQHRRPGRGRIERQPHQQHHQHEQHHQQLRPQQFHPRHRGNARHRALQFHGHELCRHRPGLAQRRFEQHHFDALPHHHEQRGSRGQSDPGDPVDHRFVHQQHRERRGHHQPLRDHPA